MPPDKIHMLLMKKILRGGGIGGKTILALVMIRYFAPFSCVLCPKGRLSITGQRKKMLHSSAILPLPPLIMESTLDEKKKKHAWKP